MKRAIPIAAVVSAAVSLAAFGWTVPSGDDSQSVSATASDAAVSQPGDTGAARLSPIERLERRLELKQETKKALGRFDLKGGREIRLYKGDTADGKSCLIDESGAGAGATCLKNGLFGSRRVAFFVNSDGGPDRFTQLYVGGVVAPNVASVVVLKTDGSSIEVAVNDERAFVFESPASELGQDVLPAALRLHGTNGKLVEDVAIPALR